MSTNRAFEAIRAGNADRLREALADDPDLAKSRDESGVSLLMQACYRKQPDLVDLLRATGLELDRFEAAAVGDRERAAARLAEAPNILRDLSPDGFTGLHLAAFFGHEPVVSLLLEHGADADAVSKNGAELRPIHSAAAAATGDIGLIEILLAYGADPGLASDDGKDAAAMADERGRTEAARLLRSRSATLTAAKPGFWHWAGAWGPIGTAGPRLQTGPKKNGDFGLAESGFAGHTDGDGPIPERSPRSY